MDTINANLSTSIEAAANASQESRPARNKQRTQMAPFGDSKSNLVLNRSRDLTYKDIKNFITMTTPFQSTANKFPGQAKPVAIIDSKEIRKQLKLKQGKQTLRVYQQQAMNTASMTTSNSNATNGESNSQKSSGQFNMNALAKTSQTPTSFSTSLRAVNLNKTENLFPLRHNPFFSNSSYSRASLSTITMTYSSLGLGNPAAGDNLGSINKPNPLQPGTLSRPLSSPMKHPKLSPSRSPSPSKTKLDTSRSRLLFSRSASIMSTVDHFSKLTRNEQGEASEADKQRAPQDKLTMQVQSHPILRNGFMRPQIVANDSKLSKVDPEFNKVSSNNESPGKVTNHPGNLASEKKLQVFHTESKTAVVVTNNKSENRTINSLLDSSKAREAFFAKLKNAETFNRQFNESSSSTSSSSSLSSSHSLASSPAITSSTSESSDSSQSDASSTYSSSGASVKMNQEFQKPNPNPAISSATDDASSPKAPEKADVTKRLFQNQHRPFDLKTNFNNVVKIDTKFKREPSVTAPSLPASLTMNGSMIKELKHRLDSFNATILNKGRSDNNEDSDNESLNYHGVAKSDAGSRRHTSGEATMKKKQEIQKEALKSLLSKRRNSANANASRTTTASKSIEPNSNKSFSELVEAKENPRVNLPEKVKPLQPKVALVTSETNPKKTDDPQPEFKLVDQSGAKSAEPVESPEMYDEDVEGIDDYDVDNDNDDDDLLGAGELDDLDGNLSDDMESTKMDLTLRKATDESRLVSEKDENEETTAEGASDDDEDEETNADISFSEYLSKFGLDYRSLLTITTKRSEDGTYTKYKPPLTLSLFSNVPPTISFVTIDEKLQEMPVSLRKLCKWKMCSITPNIVKATLSRSNFSLASSKNEWLGIWGSHMKPEGFKSIREYQKINHFPGSFQIGRKDRLCRNLYSAQAQFGKSEYNFVPVTYVLPSDYQLLKNEIESSTKKDSKWIIKPCASARGQGIKLVSKLDQIPKKRGCVVQRYLSNPYLIDGLKFDLRIYVYVTSFDPLRIYLFNDGLTRFASRKYSNSIKTISDKFMHLTNYSINKSNKEYKSNDDENACYGHKWSLKALWLYLQKKNINTEKIWENITDLVVKTIICADPHVNVLVKGNLKRKYSVHELFGFDVILDENLKPWIVEVNISPSLHSNSPLDVSIKGQMISDLLNLAGFMLPNPKEIAKLEGRKCSKKIPKLLLYNKKIQPQQLSSDEKAKHHYYIQRSHDEKTLKTITDVLTPDDLRILIESEDEYSRRGSFTRVFPTAESKKYLKFFDTNRYYNLLLNEWIDKYKNNPEKGINVLNYHCKRQVHLQNPAEHPENQWSQHQGKASMSHSYDGDHGSPTYKHSS